MNNKYAFFDFCGTLANFQTADRFVDFVRERTSNNRMNRLERLRKSLVKYYVPRFIVNFSGLHKRLKLWQLRGHSRTFLQNEAKEYSSLKLIPSLTPEIVHRYDQLKNQGYKLILTSGGYDIYLNEFVQNMPFDHVFATKVGFKNGICTGRILGIDNLGKAKVKNIKAELSLSENEMQKSIAFSDSPSDKPLFDFVGEGVFVIRHDFLEPWAKEQNLEIIFPEDA